MSLLGPIDLPSPTGGGTHYSKSLLSAYLRLTNPTRIRQDIAQFGYFLARGESDDHELIALEELKSKLKVVLDGRIEDRKNSWVNTLNNNLRIGNDHAIASMIASLWRRYLLQTSLVKAEKSVCGYYLNGNNRSKSFKHKEIKALCEWCSKEIHVLINKGFTCPYCGVYFHNFQPQKIRIKPNLDNFCISPFDHNETNEVINKVIIGEFELKKAHKKNAGQLAFTFLFALGFDYE